MRGWRAVGVRSQTSRAPCRGRNLPEGVADLLTTTDTVPGVMSRRNWTPRGGSRRLAREAAMRMVRMFLGGGFRYGLHEACGMLIGRHDLFEG